MRLEVAGREFIAVVGGEDGDPREWWTAIQHLAAQPGARRDPPGAGHPAGRACGPSPTVMRAATWSSTCRRAGRGMPAGGRVEAIRAARRTRWRAALPRPLPCCWASARSRRRALGTLKLRPLAWGSDRHDGRRRRPRPPGCSSPRRRITTPRPRPARPAAQSPPPGAAADARRYRAAHQADRVGTPRRRVRSRGQHRQAAPGPHATASPHRPPSPTAAYRPGPALAVTIADRAWYA